MDADKLQVKAEKFYLRGKWKKALNAYLQVKELKPADLRVRLKIAETLLRLERLDESKIIFRQVADLYMEDGQLHKAIAVNHRLLELDRDDREIQTKLARLYERHGKGQMRDLPLSAPTVDAKVREICSDNATQTAFDLEKKLRQEILRSDWKAALDTGIKIWQLEPRNLDHRLNIARVLKNLERQEEAAEVILGVSSQLFRQGKPLRAAFIQAELGQLTNGNGHLQKKRQEMIKNIAILCSRPQSATTVDSKNDKGNGFFPNFLRTRSEIMEEILQDLLIDPVDAGAVRPVPVLSQLPRKECEALIAALKPRNFSKGQVIFKAFENADSLFFISHGKVSVAAPRAEISGNPGEPNFLTAIEETQTLGSFGFFYDGKRHLDAIAATDLELLELSQHDLEHLQKEFPTIRDAMDELYKVHVLTPLLMLQPFFRELPEDKRLEIAGKFKSETFAPRTLDLREGTRSEKLLFIREGNVEIFWGERYQDRPLKILEPGAFLALFETLSHAVLPFSCRNSGTVRVFSLRQADLAGLAALTEAANAAWPNEFVAHYFGHGLPGATNAAEGRKDLQDLALQHTLT